MAALWVGTLSLSDSATAIFVSTVSPLQADLDKSDSWALNPESRVTTTCDVSSRGLGSFHSLWRGRSPRSVMTSCLPYEVKLQQCLLNMTLFSLKNMTWRDFFLCLDWRVLVSDTCNSDSVHQNMTSHHLHHKLFFMSTKCSVYMLSKYVYLRLTWNHYSDTSAAINQIFMYIPVIIHPSLQHLLTEQCWCCFCFALVPSHSEKV